MAIQPLDKYDRTVRTLPKHLEDVLFDGGEKRLERLTNPFRALPCSHQQVRVLAIASDVLHLFVEVLSLRRRKERSDCFQGVMDPLIQ